MKHQSNSRIITNRQLNFTSSPVDTYNRKVMPYKLPHYEIDGTWNQHQSIVLDVLLDAIFKVLYKKQGNIPKSWRSKSVITVNRSMAGPIFTPVCIKYLSKKPIEAFSLQEGYDIRQTQLKSYNEEIVNNNIECTFDEYFNRFLDSNYNYQNFEKKMKPVMQVYEKDVCVELNITDLFKNYSIMQKYRHKFFEYLNKIEETKLKMNYKVKCMIKEPKYNDAGKRTHIGKLTDENYTMDSFQQIFITKIDGDTLKLNFKSPLGKMILHNTVVLDTDWASEKVFELKKNAYFIYKRFILNRAACKNPSEEIILWFEEIKKFLDMNSKNKSEIYTPINRAFEDIKKKGLIKDFGWSTIYKQRQYKVVLDNPKKLNGNKKSKQQQLLKI